MARRMVRQRWRWLHHDIRRSGSRGTGEGLSQRHKGWPTRLAHRGCPARRAFYDVRATSATAPQASLNAHSLPPPTLGECPVTEELHAGLAKPKRSNLVRTK